MNLYAGKRGQETQRIMVRKLDRRDHERQDKKQQGEKEWIMVSKQQGQLLDHRPYLSRLFGRLVVIEYSIPSPFFPSSHQSRERPPAASRLVPPNQRWTYKSNEQTTPKKKRANPSNATMPCIHPFPLFFLYECPFPNFLDALL